MTDTGTLTMPSSHWAEGDTPKINRYVLHVLQALWHAHPDPASLDHLSPDHEIAALHERVLEWLSTDTGMIEPDDGGHRLTVQGSTALSRAQLSHADLAGLLASPAADADAIEHPNDVVLAILRARHEPNEG